MLALAIHNLFNGVVPMEALIPLELLFVYKLKAILDPVPEKKGAEDGDLSNTRCH